MTTEKRQQRHWDRWFRRTRHEFCPLLMPYAGQPNLVYVEIGCWAGASAEWVCRNILTHSTSLGIGIDPYLADPPRHPKVEIDKVRELAMTRIAALPGRKWEWFYLPSATVLRQWQTIQIDILYIDGDHNAWACVQDFALAWKWLKPGSLVIFDDYQTKLAKRYPNVAQAYDSIVKCWGPLITEVGHGPRQRAVKVVAKDLMELNK